MSVAAVAVEHRTRRPDQRLAPVDGPLGGRPQRPVDDPAAPVGAFVAVEVERGRIAHFLPTSFFMPSSSIRIGRPDSLSAWPWPVWWMSNTDWIAA